jgi:myosin-crossreactive antigen
MAGIRLDPITETAPVKVVVELAARDEEDPENWKIWEKEKNKRNMELQHARDAQKEEASKNEETAARTKGRKQALAPSVRSFTRKSRHQKRTGTATQQS